MDRFWDGGGERLGMRLFTVIYTAPRLLVLHDSESMRVQSRYQTGVCSNKEYYRYSYCGPGPSGRVIDLPARKISSVDNKLTAITELWIVPAN